MQRIDYHQCIPEGALHDEAKRSPAAGDQTVQKRQAPPANFTPIRGAQSSGGRCYPRYNIEVLQRTYPDQFNMLILAFNYLQATVPESSDVSWYGIAGIHGRPYQAWQQPSSNGPFNTNLGYCTHGTPLFSYWHRPYVLLMEQQIQAAAVLIASQFRDSNRARYQAAADQLRLPYYDWSDPAYGGRIPSFVTSSGISVTRPSSTGTSQGATIANPFYQYNFRGNRGVLGNSFSTWTHTLRDPSSSSASATSNESGVNGAMIQGFTSRRQNTYNLYSRAGFNTFSSQCEGIHNGVHTTLGGSNPMGHMSSPDVAAFDPIFWLHHANVDRLIAMYQAIYPTSLMTPATAVATYGRTVPGRDGSQDTLDTRLYPFRLSSGAIVTSREWTSGSSGIWKYHYGYPEIPCNGNPSTIGSSVRTAVNRLYGPSGASSKRRREASGYALPEPFPKVRGGFTPMGSEVGLTRNEYTIRFFIDRSEINRPWIVHIFLGEVPSSIDDYPTSPNRCGVYSSFAVDGMRMPSSPYAFDFAITDYLQQHNVALTKSAVEAYMTKHLSFVMTDGYGKTIDMSQLKTFKAGVCTFKGTYGRHGSDKLASFGNCDVLSTITQNKPGGVKNPQQLVDPTLLNGTPQNLTQNLETY